MLGYRDIVQFPSSLPQQSSGLAIFEGRSLTRELVINAMNELRYASDAYRRADRGRIQQGLAAMNSRLSHEYHAYMNTLPSGERKRHVESRLPPVRSLIQSGEELTRVYNRGGDELIASEYARRTAAPGVRSVHPADVVDVNARWCVLAWRFLRARAAEFMASLQATTEADFLLNSPHLPTGACLVDRIAGANSTTPAARYRIRA